MIPFLCATAGDGVPLRVRIQGRDPKLYKYAREALHIIIKMREGAAALIFIMMSIASHAYLWSCVPRHRLHVHSGASRPMRKIAGPPGYVLAGPGPRALGGKMYRLWG